VENRARVLEAARDCFAVSGADAQVADVARRAGVGVGTVYRHFASREALAEALAYDCVSHLLAAAEEALLVDDPAEAFAGFVREVAGRHLLDRVYGGVLPPSRPGVQPVEEQIDKLGEAATRLAARGQQAGVLRDDLPPATLAKLVRGVGLAVEAARFDAAFDPDAFVEVFLCGVASRRGAGAER